MFERIHHLLRLAQSVRREHKKAEERSPHWPAVEREHLRTHGKCAGCGSAKHLQVHHEKPFHLHPELELEPTNLVTLCMDTDECHLKIGHGDNFRAYNPNVLADAAEALARPEFRDVIWGKAKLARLRE